MDSSKIQNRINRIFRYLLFKLKYIINPVDKYLKRTVICNNCVGAMVLHDFGLKFQSPFVNLFILPSDYLKILNRLNYYLAPDSDLQDVTGDSEYPIGLLNGEIHIFFMHYKSFEDAKRKWYDRIDRMDFKNAYYIFVQQNGCTNLHLEEFIKLPYDNKIALVNFKNIRHEKYAYIKGFEDDQTLGIITNFRGLLGKRYYDYFNWRKFLNI